jgi:hypothetical protein
VWPTEWVRGHATVHSAACVWAYGSPSSFFKLSTNTYNSHLFTSVFGRDLDSCRNASDPDSLKKMFL